MRALALSDGGLERLLEEDVPCGDRTAHLLAIGERPGRMVVSTREHTTLCCTEEAVRVVEKCGGAVVHLAATGTTVEAGVDMLVVSSVYFGKPSDSGVRMEPLPATHRCRG